MENTDTNMSYIFLFGSDVFSPHGFVKGEHYSILSYFILFYFIY